MLNKLLLATSLCAALVLAGCSDDGGKDEDKALSKSEFIKQGDEICEEGTEKIDAAEDDFADAENPTEEEIETAIDDVVVPSLREQVEGLRELEPPKDDADEIDKMLDLLDADIDKLEDEGFAYLVSEDSFVAANDAAVDYGFKVCGEE